MSCEMYYKERSRLYVIKLYNVWGDLIVKIMYDPDACEYDVCDEVKFTINTYTI